eukprot:CAMPEP_0197194176 /NCGR_PEP_ID=MMETSP1423-20130617/28751_1 /TAXON_ID=476441 /ORGANISM="Pseudo-nitzschia heimii, Strain UNC1101" /LENGTH=334 /DNA_ID=CAMNT_0042647551 /DNA_START=18 /DNA_END=1022 /DNA_ORIENTATION=+
MRGLVLLLTVIVTLSFVEDVESSKLKRARRSIENSDDTEARRRLTMADDAFLHGSPDDIFLYGSERDFEVLSFHRAVGGMVKKIIGGFFSGIRGAIQNFLSLIIRMLQSMEKTVAVEEPEQKPEPPTMSSIYDSISSVMSDSNDPEPVPDAKPSVGKQRTSERNGKTPPAPNVKKSAPLLNKKNLPKASSSRDALGKKSIMEDLAKGGSSPDFDSENSAVALSTETNAVVQASYLAGLLPTLVAGLVFSTAGTIVGYLWNTEWTETAYDYYEYYWGDGYGDGKVEADPFYDVTTSSSTATGYTASSGHDDMSVTGENRDDVSSSNAVPVTPDKF